MKYIQYLALTLFVFIAFVCCEEGIDDITPVDPGQDMTAPIIEIITPVDGRVIQIPNEVASIDISFEVTDDIEISEVSVDYDGTQIAAYNNFKDYRRLVVDDLTYDDVRDGEHTLAITATDIEGKTTIQNVNFSKELPYISKYEGEVLYMPFDGDFLDYISFNEATVVGNPEFAGESAVIGGLDAYKGAPNSYLTFPTESLNLQNGGSFTAIFWTKVNASPDRAGVLVMGPPDPNMPATPNNRTKGFRFFRENAGGEQRFKLNVGNGNGDHWFDGGDAADVDPSSDDWVHMAFTISENQCVVYIDGEIVSSGEFPGINWDECDILSIMSGAPRFTQWNHLSDEGLMDELRIFNRALPQDEIQSIIAEETGQTGMGYIPVFDGEIFYMPFDGDYQNKVNGRNATVEGTPSFADDGIFGQAYQGAEDSYLTFPTSGLTNESFSASFWMKVEENIGQDRSGILVIGPEDPANPDAPNNRNSGFRFFRENAGGNQRFKLNVGNGNADNWFDGGESADVAPNTGEWTHFAFSISNTEVTVFINGEPVSSGAFMGVDWSGCDILSIMSGAPRFTGWNHLSDEGVMDELRIFDKALSQAEVEAIIAYDGMSMGSGYTPKYDGESFYLTFDGSYEDLVNGAEAMVEGSPNFTSEALSGMAYQGTEDAYLTYSTDGLLNESFSASFWYNLIEDDDAPADGERPLDRAGILVISPEDPDNPMAPNNRSNGFRFFREASNGGETQRLKLNVGTGDGETWVDGGAMADLEPNSGEWVHIAFTISNSNAIVYINGEEVRNSETTGVDWSGCNILSVMSGAPRFTGWNHWSDESLMDDLRLFHKTLSPEEIQAIMSDR